MPTYEYECDSCGRRFEQFQGITEPPLTKCPECGKRVRRLMSAGAAIHVKGNPTGGAVKGCSLESTGHTCCGRDERCGKEGCGGHDT